VEAELLEAMVLSELVDRIGGTEVPLTRTGSITFQDRWWFTIMLASRAITRWLSAPKS
jgi:hypothetical protein